MRFDNAFMCKSGVVGMQFIAPKHIVSVFHDGKCLQVSEHIPMYLHKQALALYFKLLHRFKKAV